MKVILKNTSGSEKGCYCFIFLFPDLQEDGIHYVKLEFISETFNKESSFWHQKAVDKSLIDK